MMLRHKTVKWIVRVKGSTLLKVQSVIFGLLCFVLKHESRLQAMRRWTVTVVNSRWIYSFFVLPVAALCVGAKAMPYASPFML